MRASGDKRWRREVIEALEKAGTVNGAAGVLGIGRGTLQRWIKAEPDIIALVQADLPPGPGNPGFGPEFWKGMESQGKPSNGRRKRKPVDNGSR